MGPRPLEWCYRRLESRDLLPVPVRQIFFPSCSRTTREQARRQCLPQGNPVRLAGVQTLFSFRNLTDMKVVGPHNLGNITVRHTNSIGQLTAE
jgi:hypothetical protein